MSLFTRRSTAHSGARRGAVVLVAAFSVLGLTACGDNSSSGASATSAAPSATASASATAASGEGVSIKDAKPGDKVNVKSFIEESAAAQKTLKSYKVAYDMTVTTGGSNQVIKGSGSVDQNDAANPKMEMVTEVGPQKMKMVLVGKDAYIQQAAGGKYTKMDLEQLAKASGQDLSKMTDPMASLRESEKLIKSIEFVGEEQVGSVKTRKYQAVMTMPDTGAAASVAPSGGMTLPTEIPYEYWLAEEGYPVKFEFDLPMGTTRSKTSMVMSDFNKPVNVTVPAASEVVATPGG